MVRFHELGMITVGVYYRSETDAHVNLMRIKGKRFLFFYPHRIQQVDFEADGKIQVTNTWKAL